MISAEGFAKGKAELEAIYSSVQHQELVEIFYGNYDKEVGWHMVTNDYPDFVIFHIGNTFEEALQTANEWLQEMKSD